MNKVFIISYQLRENSTYDKFYEQIRTIFPKNKHICENTWLIKTDSRYDAANIFNIVHEFMGMRDTLFVAQIHTDDCEGMVPKGTWNWLMEN